MNLNDYQDQAGTTAIYPGCGTGSTEALIYTALKMNGEAGEIAEKVGKALRDNGGLVDATRERQLILELGDVLWYVARMAAELGASLEDVAQENLNKLADRAARGALGGSGDAR